MVHKNKPKYTKGALVSFAGANHLKALKKTFVHAIATEDEINFYYLIEHPKGIVLCDATRSQFTFDLRGVKDGLRYIVAEEGELSEVQGLATTEPAVNANLQVSELGASSSVESTGQEGSAVPALERDPNEEVSIKMPYYQWLAVMSGLQTTQAILVQNKMGVMLQPGMTEELYQEQLKGNEDAQKTIEAANI